MTRAILRAHFPASPPPYPALLVLHPSGRWIAGGMSPDLMATATRLHENFGGATLYLAAEAGLAWDRADDVAYVRRVLRDTRELLDPARLAVVGWSSGGELAQRLGCLLPGIFAAIVSNAASLAKQYTPSVPTPVLMFNNEQDDVWPFQEQPRSRFRGVLQTRDVWATLGGAVELVRTDAPHARWPTDASARIWQWLETTLEAPVALKKKLMVYEDIDAVIAARLAAEVEATGQEVRRNGLWAYLTKTQIVVKKETGA